MADRVDSGDELAQRFLARYDDAEQRRRLRRSHALKVVWLVLFLFGVATNDRRFLAAACGLALVMTLYWGANLLCLLWWRHRLTKAGLM